MQIKWWRSGFFYLLLLAVIIALVIVITPRNDPKPVTLADFVNEAKPQKFETIGYWQEGQKLIGVEAKEVIYWTPYTKTPKELDELFNDEGVNFNTEKEFESNFNGYKHWNSADHTFSARIT